MNRPKRESPLPSWLVGLLLAAVIFAIALVLLDLFGYGDDPVIDEGAGAALALLL